jgi:hypothetical protein
MVVVVYVTMRLWGHRMAKRFCSVTVRRKDLANRLDDDEDDDDDDIMMMMTS